MVCLLIIAVVLLSGCTAPMIDNTRTWNITQTATNMTNVTEVLKEDNTSTAANVSAYKK